MPVHGSQFLPSTDGFLFSNNDWPDESVFDIDLPVFGKIPIGNAGGGLCGGMTFAAKDRYIDGRGAPPDKVVPAKGTPLFKEIAAAMVHSLRIPFGIMRFWSWMIVPGVRFREALNEADAYFNGGETLQPLGIVWQASHKVADLAQCHQVLVYSMQYPSTGDDARLWIYDSNYPKDNNVTITLSGGRIVHSRDGEMHGFFRNT